MIDFKLKWNENIDMNAKGKNHQQLDLFWIESKIDELRALNCTEESQEKQHKPDDKRLLNDIKLGIKSQKTLRNIF